METNLNDEALAGDLLVGGPAILAYLVYLGPRRLMSTTKNAPATGRLES